MLISLTHETSFEYTQPVVESAMELRLTPPSDEHQTVRSHALDVQPRARLFAHTDYFRNTVYFFTVSARHAHLTVVNRALVDTSRANLRLVGSGDPDLDPGPVPLFDYQQFGGPVVRHPELAVIAGRFRDDRDLYGRLKALTAFLRDRIEYRPLVTRVDSGLDEVLVLGQGVCQDFAHLMIGVCRELGVPARYASGYVCTDAGHERGSGATHAWCECYVPELGWVGFDPTNNLLVDDHYVLVARGRDYRDVPPTKGMYRGSAEEAITVTVRTECLDGLGARA